MKRFAALALTTLILLALIPAEPGAGAAPAPVPATAGPALDYHIKALKDDHPEVTLSVGGAPGTTTLLELQPDADVDLRRALTGVEVTAAGGQPLPWRWSSQQGLTVENGDSRDFQIRYTLDGLAWEGFLGQKTFIMRERYLFFIAGEILLMPDAEPQDVTVRFTLPPGHRIFSSLRERDGVFTAERGLWGDLRYDFRMAYFTGGVPLYVIERTTPRGDTYQLIRFERDMMDWRPSLGTTPWEEDERKLDTFMHYLAEIEQQILPPLPPHKVLFANGKRIHDPAIKGVIANTDWYHHMQLWGRQEDQELAHHILHQWSMTPKNSKLAFRRDSLGEMFREGPHTYYEQLLPAGRGQDWSPGKIFEFWVLDQRGRPAGIQQNYWHKQYNLSAMRVYLLDQDIQRTTSRDLSALMRALWDEAKDLKEPRYLTDAEIRRALARVVGSQNQGALDRIAAQTEFPRADFAALEPAFRLYVDHWAREAFWDKPLLFLIYLELAANLGDVWPHYATYPNEIPGMGMDVMRQFKEALAARAGASISQADLLVALSQVTGQQHSGFFAFWSSLGYDLDPNSLLPLTAWTPDGYDEWAFLSETHLLGGTLQTEHYLSGLPQQATAVLDEPAPTDTIEIVVDLRSFDGVPPVAEVEKALSGPNVEFQWSYEHQHRNLYRVSGIFKVRTDDPERRRFSFTLNLPAFASHPRFTVITGRDANGQPVVTGNRKYPPELAFLHALDQIPFTATWDGAGLRLETVSLPDAYFQVAGEKARPGETVTLPAGTGGSLQVDLYDKYGFLRGRQSVSRTEPLPEPKEAPAPAPAPAERPISVTLNGRPLVFDVDPALVNGRLLVPVRALGEALGATVSWDEASQTAVLTRGEKVIRLTLGQAEAFVSGRAVLLDVPAERRGGRVLVPLRFIVETLDLDVRWDEATQTAVLTSR